MLSPVTFLRIVRASAWYDLLVTVGFATPWTFVAVMASLQSVSDLLGLAATFPPFGPEPMLMANLLGSLVTVWSIVRLRAASLMLGRADAAARLLFATWQGYALLIGAHPIIWGFLCAELAFGVAQLLPVESRQVAEGLAGAD